MRVHFTRWKETLQQQSRLQNIQNRMDAHKKQLKRQIDQTQKLFDENEASSQNLDEKHLMLKQKLSQMQSKHLSIKESIESQKQANQAVKVKKEPGRAAQDYADKIKQERQQKQQNSTSGAGSSRLEQAKKESMKQRLVDQHNQLKRQNRNLKEKLEKTQSNVEQFLGEMGSLIDQAEQDTDLSILSFPQYMNQGTNQSQAAPSGGGLAETAHMQPFQSIDMTQS